MQLGRVLTQRQFDTLFRLSYLWGVDTIAILATLAAPLLEAFAEELAESDAKVEETYRRAARA